MKMNEDFLTHITFLLFGIACLIVMSALFYTLFDNANWHKKTCETLESQGYTIKEPNMFTECKVKTNMGYVIIDQEWVKQNSKPIKGDE